MLDAGEDRTHHPVFSEMAGGQDWVMVRDGDWKYVASREANEPLGLYNLVDGPGELEDRLAADEGEAARLAAVVDGWRAEVGLTASGGVSP